MLMAIHLDLTWFLFSQYHQLYHFNSLWQSYREKQVIKWERLPASTVKVVTCLLAFVRWRWCRIGVLHSFSLVREYSVLNLHRHCLLQENLLWFSKLTGWTILYLICNIIVYPLPLLSFVKIKIKLHLPGKSFDFKLLFTGIAVSIEFIVKNKLIPVCSWRHTIICS